MNRNDTVSFNINCIKKEVFTYIKEKNCITDHNNVSYLIFIWVIILNRTRDE